MGAAQHGRKHPSEQIGSSEPPPQHLTAPAAQEEPSPALLGGEMCKALGGNLI